MKNNASADKFSNEGNVFFQKSKFYEAMVSYNKSLCHAMPQSSQLGLAYANRSAVYLEVKQFDKCLDNIQLARDNKYPDEAKLKEREMKCTEELKMQQPDPKNDPWTYFKLSYPANEKIPFIVDCLEVKTDEKFGRHIVTNRDLKPGDVIAIEKPIFSTINRSDSYTNCTFCLKSNMLNLIPCSHENDPNVCTSAMYCDLECSTKARERFHKGYCKIVHLLSPKMSEGTIDTATSAWKGLMESLFIMKHPKFLKGLMSSNKQTTIFDYDLSDQTDDAAADFKHLTIFNNLEMDPNKFIESERRELSALFVEVFSQLKAMCNSNPELMSLLVEYSTRLAMIKRRNCIAFVVQEEEAGSVVLPFASLYNHACDINICLILIDNKFVHIVLKPVKKGEQLFYNYGYDFAKDQPDRVQRQEAIMKGFNFKCSCAACLNNYSMFSAPMHKMPPSCNFLTTIEGSMIALKKHCEYIESNFKNYPTKGLIVSLKCCESLLTSVESKAMWPFSNV